MAHATWPMPPLARVTSHSVPIPRKTESCETTAVALPFWVREPQRHNMQKSADSISLPSSPFASRSEVRHLFSKFACTFFGVRIATSYTSSSLGRGNWPEPSSYPQPRHRLKYSKRKPKREHGSPKSGKISASGKSHNVYRHRSPLRLSRDQDGHWESDRPK
jgi:hypothetical protein